MAKIEVPAATDTVVYAGGTAGVIIANGGSSLMHLNVEAPSTGGGAIELGSGDSIAMELDSPWAAEQWTAWSDVGTTAVVVTI